MATEFEAKGRLYNLGNDYPADVGFRDTALTAGDTWISGSYLDGIYTSAAEGFITGAWNKYFNTILPQETWVSADSAHQFSPDYAIAEVNVQSAYNTLVSAYPSNGYEAVIAAQEANT